MLEYNLLTKVTEKWFHYTYTCYLVTKSCLTLCNRMEAAHQTSLSFTISQSLFKLISIESLMPSNHLSLIALFFCFQSFQLQGLFQWVSSLHQAAKVLEFQLQHQSFQWIFTASVLPMDIQDRFPLGLTGLISMHSKGLSRVFSNATFQKHHLFGAQPSSQSNSHVHTWLLEKP